MASISRQVTARQPFRLYVYAVLVSASVIWFAVALPIGNPLQWGALLPIITGAIVGVRWHQSSKRVQAQQLISARLARLPSDFLVLHNLIIPAPWGPNPIDHLLLSRFGVVVVADGVASRWMLEQVEAVRALLFAQGFKSPQVPVRSLVLLPPGSSDIRTIESDAPVIRVEQIRLHHLAPVNEAVLSPGQIDLIARTLRDLAQRT